MSLQSDIERHERALETIRDTLDIMKGVDAALDKQIGIIQTKIAIVSSLCGGAGGLLVGIAMYFLKK